MMDMNLVKQQLALLHGPILDAVLVRNIKELGEVACHPHIVYVEVRDLHII